jgi:hypothetical protein
MPTTPPRNRREKGQDENRPKGFGYKKEDNILLPDHKAIYFPIPKVASSSLKLVLSDLLGLVPPDPTHPDRLPHQRDFPFALRTEIRDHYADHFKFTVVRNPFSRLLSCYRNKIASEPVTNAVFLEGVHRGFQRHVSRLRHGMTFEEFVRAVAEIDDADADKHIRSQHLFVCDAEGRLLSDHVAKFERLATEMRFIFERIGAPMVKLPHQLSSGKNTGYRRHYSPESRALAEQRYARDLELFGYTF